MDPKTILKVLQEASPLDIFLVSFLLLPFVADAWLDALESLELDKSEQACVLITVVMAYIVGMILVLVKSSRLRNREVGKDQIIRYLTEKDFEMISFERIRKNINKSYGDAFLDELIKRYPDELRRARLKGGKDGVARIADTVIEEE